MDDTDLAALAQVTTARAAEDPTPTAVTQVAARPRDLRAAVIAAAKRDGVPVVVVTAENLTREHTCGHILREDPPQPGRSCARGCGRYYDPDLSATLLMLMRAAAPRTRVMRVLT